jgi:hypothetical protein
MIIIWLLYDYYIRHIKYIKWPDHYMIIIWLLFDYYIRHIKYIKWPDYYMIIIWLLYDYLIRHIKYIKEPYSAATGGKEGQIRIRKMPSFQYRKGSILYEDSPSSTPRKKALPEQERHWYPMIPRWVWLLVYYQSSLLHTNTPIVTII